jgi:hypothetical protein
VDSDQNCTIPKNCKAWHFCSECGSRLFYSLNANMLKDTDDKYIVSIGLLHKICEEDLIMENEFFFDMKPDYYSFHETKKFSSDDTLKE